MRCYRAPALQLNRVMLLCQQGGYGKTLCNLKYVCDFNKKKHKIFRFVPLGHNRTKKSQSNASLVDSSRFGGEVRPTVHSLLLAEDTESTRIPSTLRIPL